MLSRFPSSYSRAITMEVKSAPMMVRMITMIPGTMLNALRFSSLNHCRVWISSAFGSAWAPMQPERTVRT